MDGRGGCTWGNVEFHDFFGQQANRPAGVTRGSRRARQCRKPGVEGSIESDSGWPGSRLAFQSRIDSVLHEPRFEVFYGARSHSQGIGHIGYFPRGAVGPGVTKQQCPGVDKLRRVCLAAARERFQSTSFFLGESYSVSWCHHGSIYPKTHPIKIRN